MKIWRLGYDSNNYEGFQVANGDWSIADQFIGRSLHQEWEPFELKVYEEAPRSDAPTFMGCAPVFSSQAVATVKGLLEGLVELLPTYFPREEYFILNVLNVLDCMDYDQSEVVRFRSGRVMRFKKYGFIPEIVTNQHIFKIKEIPEEAVFVSDEFRNNILNSRLVGFRFEEVWSSN
ncbi:hypothetical protein HQN90_22725 [Paenibacillus alba]|uniref:imm11 family protein n=1 Tax=Paenibacillus alba TaxID=1197127 RepID=UPI0015634497|nr:DUF1629 domain-containing protein [Paenibacillus alba]NQX68947.1 hypothetical protein [Paenibacillus alba]